MTDRDAGQALRDEIRAWLKENAPGGWRDVASHAEFVKLQREWFGRLVQAGYGIPHWSAEWPGGGRTLAEQKVIYEELARSDAPRLLLTFVASYHTYATLAEHGSDEQKARFLPGILAGDIWCQGFSEPNAGSDLAAIRTKAVLRNGVYIVDGQKIWSTMAQHADRCLLLARVAESDVKQAGLVFLLLDMRAAGVTVKPIRQITGDEEFAEIFLDGVEVPLADRVGEEGEGWRIAQTTLASERGLTLLELSNRMHGTLWRLAEAARSVRRDDRHTLFELGRLATRVAATKALADQFLERRIAGREQVGDASLVKNAYSTTLRAWADLGLRLAPFEAQYRAPIVFGELNSGNWMADFMASYAWSIAGGSEEIQRNIIAERVLGMPREPKAWSLQS